MDAPLTSDTGKPLPKQVRARGDQARKLQAEQRGEPVSPAPANGATVNDPSQVAATPTAGAAPDALKPAEPSGTPTPTPAPSPLTAEVKPPSNDGAQHLVEGKDAKFWNDRYKSTLGSLRAERERFHQENDALSEQLANLQIELAQARAPKAEAPKLDEFLSAEQIAALGEDKAAEILTLAVRAATEEAQRQVKPVLDAAKQREERATTREVTAARRAMWDELVDQVPNWKAINDTPEFKAYCLDDDEDWQEQRQERIQRAMAANNGKLLAGVFLKFLSTQPVAAVETGAKPSVLGKSDAAGGGAPSPAAARHDDNDPDADPYDVAIVSRKQISELYTKLARDRKLSDKQRDLERRKLDQRVRTAQLEGKLN